VSEPEHPDATARRFAANTLWVLAADLVAKLAALAMFVVVARVLVKTDFGHFVFALAFTPLFFVFGATGMNAAVVREISRNRRRFAELFVSGLWIRLAIGAVALALIAVVAPFIVSGRAAFLAVVIVGIASFTDDLTNHHLSAFRAFEQMRFYAVIDVVNRIFSTLFVCLVLIVTHSLIVVTTAYLLGSAASLGTAYLLLRRRLPTVRLRASGSRTAMRELLSLGTPLGVGGMINTAAFRIDTVMLQAIKGSLQVATYGTAYSIFTSLVAVSWSLSATTLPGMARAGRGREAARVYRLAATAVAILFFPAVVTVPFAATAIVRTIFSARYSAAGPALAVLVGAALLYAVAYISRVACVALGYRRSIPMIAAVTLLVNVGANAVAIPLWGFRGAAWTTLGTEVVEAALFVALLLRAGIAPPLRAVRVPAIAAAWVLVVLAAGGLRGGGAVLAAGIVYPIALLGVWRLIAPQQLAAVGRALRRGTPQALVEETPPQV